MITQAWVLMGYAGLRRRCQIHSAPPVTATGSIHALRF